MKRSIMVVLREWCPDCLEYKLSLNKLLSKHNLDIKFVFPEEVDNIYKIYAIPTTLFLENESVISAKLDSVEHDKLIEYFSKDKESQ